MQHYGKPGMLTGKTILFFILLTIVAFLPVSSFQFFLKNDAFSGYFPPKFFMSESLGDGILPLWNPFINFGLPQYADMSSGFWSPITWLIAATVGYNAYSFTIEVLLYLFISGVGMYAVCAQYKFQQAVCLVAGVSYMCSGYMVGHMQHFNWLSGAAFLPCCLWAYKNLLQEFNLKNILVAALLFYMLIASAHPGIIIGSIYFFPGYMIFYFFFLGKANFLKTISSIFYKHFLLVSILLLLASGLVLSYADIIPHFTRTVKPAAEAIINPVSYPSWISFLFPLSTVKNDLFFATDISMRNVYTGLAITIFFIVALIRKKRKEQWFFLSSFLFFALLSTGGIFTSLFYRLPLMGFVRLPGEYVVFGLLSFILFSAFALNRFVDGRFAAQVKLSFVITIFSIVILLVFSWSLYHIIFQHQSIIFPTGYPQSFTGHLKWFIDHLSFYDVLCLQCIIQFIIARAINYTLLKKRFHLFTYIVAADLIIATLLHLPYTAVGQAPVSAVQEVLNQSPTGIPIPALEPIVSNDTGNVRMTSLVGNWSFYNKQPGVTSQAAYPIELINTKTVFQDTNQKHLYRPLVFTQKGNAILSIEKYTGQQITINIQIPSPDTLVLQQVLYPHWKVFINGTKAIIINYRNIYPAVLVPAGKHRVEFVFRPTAIKNAMIFSLAIFTLCILLLLIIPFSPSLQKLQPGP